MSYLLKLVKKLIKVIMGIVSAKEKSKDFNSPIELQEKEIEFILAKLRLATYKGDEFEMFYHVWVKLSNKLEKNK